MTTINVPKIFWALGDPEQVTHSGVTRVTRPLYYAANGDGKYVRVGAIDPDLAEPLMTALGA